MKRVYLIVLAVVIIGVGVFLIVQNNSSGDDMSSNTTGSSSSESSTSSNQAAQENQNEVSISDMSFTPAKITVKKGTKVTWTNNDDTTHTVTSDSGKTLDSGSLDRGESYTVSFDTVGSFPYHCAFHTGMTGTVTVTE